MTGLNPLHSDPKLMQCSGDSMKFLIKFTHFCFTQF